MYRVLVFPYFVSCWVRIEPAHIAMAQAMPRKGKLLAQSTASRSRSPSRHHSAIAAVVAVLQDAGHPQVSTSGAAARVSSSVAHNASCLHAAHGVLRERAVLAQSTADKGRFVAGGTTLGTSVDVSNRGVQVETGAVAQSTVHQNASSAADSNAGAWWSRAAKAGLLEPAPKLGRELESSHAEGKDERSEAQDALAMPSERSAAEHDQSAAPVYGVLKECATESGQQQEQPPQSLGCCVESCAGDVTRAELELEVLHLQDKRRRLVQLSRDVLEVRCPGFCQMAAKCEDDYLREAGHALASISGDVDAAAQALRTAAASWSSVAQSTAMPSVASHFTPLERDRLVTELERLVSSDGLRGAQLLSRNARPSMARVL